MFPITDPEFIRGADSPICRHLTSVLRPPSNQMYNMKLPSHFHSLPAQIILRFTAVIVLTAAAIGLPAIWLIRGQLEHQAWSQVDQGYRAAQALYAAKQSEVGVFAILTAQRPTLHELLAQEDKAAVDGYLRILRTGTGLDLVLVCDADHAMIASTEELLSGGLCESWAGGGFYIVSAGTLPQAWMVAVHPVESQAIAPADVIVGVKLDADFAAQMRTQTGLDHTIWAAGQPVATSLNADIAQLAAASHQCSPSTTPEDAARATFELDGRPYYSAQFLLDTADLSAEVALSVADITALQRRLAWIVAGGILTVTAAGSALGIYLARRISRPLVRLADAAAELSKGDLSSPIHVDAWVGEVGEVARALEGARVDLLHNLTDLQREKAWVDHLLESIVEGIMTLDRYGRITYFSHGAERITGWSRDKILNRSCDCVFRLIETNELFSQFIPAPGKRKRISVELAGGRQATLAISGARLAPLEAGDAQVALVFRDVSDEDALRRLLGYFLANVTHEFRTPLSALAASVELLLDQAPDLSPAELQELLISIHLGTLGLQTLVDNLLDSASIEAGRFRILPRQSDLGEIIAGAAQTMQPLFEKYAQHLIVELPATIPSLRVDMRHIVQVLINLLSNASKYGPSDAEITIRASVDDNWCKVEVADQGKGIPSEQRANLFHRFVNPGVVNGHATVGVGVGLGLSVVKAIVDAHGGQVGVDDRTGGGAIFWFTLPIATE